MILDLILVLIIFVFALIGAKRGFVDSVLRFLNKIVALIVSLTLAKPFASILESTPLATLATNIISPIADINLPSFIEGIDITSILSSWLLIAFAFIILYIISFIVFKIIRSLANAITSLPVLKQIDSLAGFALGLCEALVVIFICFGILSIFESTTILTGFFTQLNSSYLSAYLYNNNFIVNILFSSTTEITEYLTQI